MERIALVNICFPKEIDILSPPQGLLSIATVLKENSIESRIYDSALDINYKDFTLQNITDYLIGIEENVIGISTWDSVFPKIILASQTLKEKFPHKIIILGGPTVSNLKDGILKQFPWIDYCISGEGENSFLKLVKFLINNQTPDFSKLPCNVSGNFDKKIYFGSSLTENGNTLSIPILDYSTIEISKYNRLEISSSRGCPFNCEFCSVNSTLDKKLRFRPLEHIFKEIDTLFLEGISTCINIVDDNFGLNKERLKEFCKLFKIKYPNFNWTCYFRLDDLESNIVDMMVDSGCIGAFIGIETGNNEKLKSLGKYVAFDEVVSKLKYATSKMDITASFIWGFPDESENQLIDTFSLINNIAEFENIIIDLYQLSPLTGTNLQKRMLSHLTFDRNAISGFVYPRYLPSIDNIEENLIKEIPEFFSAFYHEDSSLFGNKYYMVKKFFQEINQT